MLEKLTIKNRKLSEAPNMSQELIVTIEKHFESLPDPRRETANQRHKFIDITFQQFVAQSVELL